MNFKDLQFSYNKFKTDVQSQLAKNNPMQKQDTKALSMWIFHERNDLATMRTMSYQRTETNKALKAWVKEEVEEEKLENGRDLEDIVGDKLTRLLDKQIEIEQEYANKFQQYRHAVKSIRDREDKLSDAREKKRSLQSRILNLSKTSPRSPKLAEFQKELKSLARDTHENEMDLADFKRFALKEAFYLRFNAMNEYAEKTALIAGFGKYLTDLIEIEPTPPTQQNRSPYDKGPQAAIIFADAINAVDSWKPDAEDERPTLANAITGSKGKGKETAVGDESEIPVVNVPKGSPPELPPRRPTLESINIAPVQTQPTGYTSDEIANVTGDLKTAQENEIDLEKIDLYDAPPPAYDGPPLHSNQQHISSPLNSDLSTTQENYTFSSPYQSNASLPPAPQPQHQYQLYDSPAIMHQQLQSSPYPHHQQYQHQDSSFYDATSMMYNTQVNYQQLYRQVSQRRQPAAYRPYSEFQQQINHNYQNTNTNTNNTRQRVDVGGFRIPAPASAYGSAEDEKEKLAQHYRQEEQQQQQQQYNFEGSQFEGSQYGGGSFYGGSQYGGLQYGGSQYGGLAGNPQVQQTPHQQPQQLHPQSSVKANTTSSEVQSDTPIDSQTLHKPNYEQKIQEEE